MNQERVRESEGQKREREGEKGKREGEREGVRERERREDQWADCEQARIGSNPMRRRKR